VRIDGKRGLWRCPKPHPIKNIPVIRAEWNQLPHYDDLQWNKRHGVGRDSHTDGYIPVRYRVVQLGCSLLFIDGKNERGNSMRMNTCKWNNLLWLSDEEGQTLPWMALLLVLFMGMAGLTTDLAHAYYCKRELQASTDAAALAGAYALASSTATTSSVQSAVSSFSSASGNANATSDLPSPVLSTSLECLTSVANSGVLCTASPTGNNALQVTQTVTIPTYFIRVLSAFGAPTNMTVSATSTAAMRGSTNAQYNVAIVIDTTNSMGQNDTDASCNSTRIKCALAGVQTLLQSLSPCTASSTSTSCTAFDQVSMFTFPNVSASTASNDTTCPTSNPTIEPYYLPTSGATWSAPTGNNATYQIATFSSNYSSTNKAGGALSTSSALAISTGAKSGCQGLQTPGGDGTYYAGVIYAAQSALIAAQNANPGSLNAMVILTDGDASSTKICKTWSTTTPGTCTTYAGNNGNVYGSAQDQCQQAISAANAATAAGTRVYTIAYGASSSGCSTDTSGPLAGLSPCTAVKDMASSASNFYSDATASQNKGQCTSAANPNLTLNNIFKQVATTFTVARLIPNNAT
jgi:Flp pilus assembly protein TadG